MLGGAGVRRFDLLLTGRILPGHQREDVVAALTKVLDLSEIQAQALLSGREWVVSQNLDRAALEKCQAALNSAGVETGVREVASQVLPVVEKLLACPCCGRITLLRRGSGDPCRSCGWRDDPRQNEYYPDQVLSGINRGLSLRQGREQYEYYGSLDPDQYTPNQVPLRKRVIHGFWALFIMAYCGYSVWSDSLYVPGFGGGGYARSVRGATLHGIDAWLMSAALMSTALFLALLIIDHYDRRRTEHHYQRAGRVCIALTAVFITLAFCSESYRTHGLLLTVPLVLTGVAIVGAVLVHLKDVKLTDIGMRRHKK